MMQWNEISVRLMSDFATYTLFYEKLAKVILPYLHKDGHICDAGCGLGYLGRELAKQCRQVTAIEMNPCAAAAGQRLQSDVKNLRVLEGDIHLLPPEQPYDDMVFCFFGQTLESLLVGKRQCKGKIIMVKRDMDNHRFSTKYIKLWKQPLIDTVYSLEQWRVPYEKIELTLEAGQPFYNLQDGVDFFKLYSQDIRSDDITEQEVSTRLIKGKEPFPYYLPMERKMGIVIVDTKDVDGGKLWKKVSYSY